jgi:hypothetical protein
MQSSDQVARLPGFVPEEPLPLLGRAFSAISRTTSGIEFQGDPDRVVAQQSSWCWGPYGDYYYLCIGDPCCNAMFSTVPYNCMYDGECHYDSSLGAWWCWTYRVC